MRPDMHELLVERPRWAHRDRYPRAYARNRGGRDFAELPLREAMGRGYGTKRLSENFQPLVRFLATNAGRPWSKVRAEMASVLRPTNAVQKHVLDHVADFLYVNVREVDGRLWGASRYGVPVALVATHRPSFFVHPRTGILTRLPLAARPPYRPRTDAPIRAPLLRETSKTSCVMRVAGVWFVVTLAAIPTGVPYATVRDAVARRKIEGDAYRQFPEMLPIWRSNRYAIALRQPSKKELRALLEATEPTR